MQILQAFLTLLLFQLAGDTLQSLLHLPLPGPVLGMALLALWLLFKPAQLHGPLGKTADQLLTWLGLLFVPAGTAVVANLAMLRAAWLPASVALIGSTLLTLAVTAFVMQTLARRRTA